MCHLRGYFQFISTEFFILKDTPSAKMSDDLLCYLSSPDSHFIICQRCEDVTLATHQRPKLRDEGLTLKNVGLKFI